LQAKDREYHLGACEPFGRKMLRCVITKSCRTNEIGASIRKSAFTEAIISSFEF
jgi:hypothetical protein